MGEAIPRLWRAAMALALLGAASALAMGRLEPALALLTDRAPVAANTFATAPSFCSQRALTFLTGFETGTLGGSGVFDVGQWTGGVPAVDASVYRTGAYAVRIPKTVGGASSLTKSTTGSTAVVRLALRFDALPVVNVAQLVSVGVSGGSVANVRYNATAQKLEVGFGAGPGALAGAPVTAGSWSLLDLRVDVGASPRTIAWRVDGVAQTGVSAAEPAATTTGVTIGSSATADVFAARYDDLAISATAADYPIGSGGVLALGPSSSTTAAHSDPTRFNDNSGGPIDSTIHLRIDDVPMTSVSDYVKQMSPSSSAYVQVDLADPTATCINGVLAHATFHSQNGGTNADNHGAVRVVDGTVESVVHAGSMFSTVLVHKSAIVRPASGSWTNAALSGLVARVGYSTDVNPTPFWDAVLVEYDAAP